MTTSCSFCGSPHDTPEQIERHKKFMKRFHPELEEEDNKK